jgi:hypothetical protein
MEGCPLPPGKIEFKRPEDEIQAQGRRNGCGRRRWRVGEQQRVQCRDCAIREAGDRRAGGRDVVTVKARGLDVVAGRIVVSCLLSFDYFVRRTITISAPTTVSAPKRKSNNSICRLVCPQFNGVNFHQYLILRIRSSQAKPSTNNSIIIRYNEVLKKLGMKE